MKVTAFVGSARKKHTYKATEQFIYSLQSLGDVEYEIVALSDYHIEVCKGCKLCLDRGEELCPLKDDRDILIEKMDNSDGVIFASPNYSFNVSGLMKVFLDRLGFIFHRPRFFGKSLTSIVVQGVYGGDKITDYFNFIGKSLGYNAVKGCCLNSLEPMTAKDQKKTDMIIEKQSKKFYSALIKKEYPNPTFFQLMIFRMARTSMNLVLDDNWRDYTYYNKNGWFESDYYYPIQLNPLKKLTGKFFDFLFTSIYRKKVTGNQVQTV
jgi:multimeric flavodoxin WrbA